MVEFDRLEIFFDQPLFYVTFRKFCSTLSHWINSDEFSVLLNFYVFCM